MVLRDRFGIIIVCLSTRLNELLLCCILAITMALIVRTPCGTIKILSECPICLPAMPAVHVPFLGLCQSPLLLFIIHKLPDDFRDSWDSESRRMLQRSWCPASWILNWLSGSLWPVCRSMVLVVTGLIWSEEQGKTLLWTTDSFQKCSSTCLMGFCFFTWLVSKTNFC